MKRIEEAKPVRAFERQPREGRKPFAAFALYLSLGEERSYQKVADQLQKSSRLLRRWSKKFDWPGRVDAYDAHMHAVEVAAKEAFIRADAAEWAERGRKIREDEWKVSEELIALGREGIRRWLAQEKRVGTQEGIARLLELACRLGHQATGIPMQRVEHTGEGGGPIRVEFEAALQKVYGDVVEVEVASDQGSVTNNQVGEVRPVASLPEKTEGK